MVRDTGSARGRGGFAGGRGGSAAGRVRFIANSISGTYVSANTDGLQVQWSSRLASSRGIVPTNLFGGADASPQPSADTPDSWRAIAMPRFSLASARIANRTALQVFIIGFARVAEQQVCVVGQPKWFVHASQGHLYCRCTQRVATGADQCAG